MAKGIDLERHLAGTGPWGAPTIAHLRKKLRLANLLQCSGQGTAARNIVASDVTKFFLGLVAADRIKHAPAAISLSRAADYWPSASENCDPWPFSGVRDDANLGEFLDALLAGKVSSAFEPDFACWAMRFEFQVMAGDRLFVATLIFDPGDESHVVRFFGITDAFRSALHYRCASELPASPQVDRVCVVRTTFIRDLIAFTSNALTPKAARLDNRRPQGSNNPFWNNGRFNRLAPSDAPDTE